MPGLEATGPVVVCGARGFVGAHLVRRLLDEGLPVRATSRNPQRATPLGVGGSWVRLDVEEPQSIREAFAGADTVVYLVHQMRSEGGDLAEKEARSARHVLQAAEEQGVRRIVYLGGPAPASGAASHHLEARLRTGEILRGGSVSTIELRAGMIIGAGSESWMICRDLAMRLPLMILPRWLENRSQPIGIDDVIEGLFRAVGLERADSAWYDLPGPEVISGKQILLRIAAQAGGRPLMIPVPVLTPSLSSHWIRLVTRADYRIARYLVDGLTTDLIATGPSLWDAIEREPLPLDEIITSALAAEPDLGRRGRMLEGVAAVLRPAL